jgi:hypothetical protein
MIMMLCCQPALSTIGVAPASRSLGCSIIFFLIVAQLIYSEEQHILERPRWLSVREMQHHENL